MDLSLALEKTIGVEKPDMGNPKQKTIRDSPRFRLEELKMKCPVCGNEVPPGSKFCNGCGGQLISEGVSFEEKPEYDEESQTPSSHYDSRLTRYYAAWGVIRGVIGWFMLAIIGLIGGIILVALGWLSRSPGLWLAGFLLVIVGFLAIFPLRVLLRDVYTEEGASLSYDEWKKY